MTSATKQLTCAILATFVAACGGCNNSPPPPPAMQPVQPMPVQPVAPMPAQAAPCDQAVSLATSTSIQSRAAAEAKGMKPDGAPVCGVVGEGQTVTGPIFTLEQGYCYTVIGQSLPPVAQMEMVLQGDATALVAPIMPTMAGAAQAPLLVTTTPGERVAMGEGQSCYKWAFPVPATVKLILKARAGSGPIAAQVYRKKSL